MRALAVAFAVTTLAACAAPAPAPPVPTADPPTVTSAPAASVTPSPATAATCDAWPCDQQERFRAVEDLVRRRSPAPGWLAVSFADRVTGATWSTGDTGRAGWTASTIKLAIAADLLTRDRGGQIALSATDHHDIAAMLNSSDEAASDRLWKAYGGDAMLARFRTAMGMTGLRFVPGFTRDTYWGFVKCTIADFGALLHHVLDGVDPRDRAVLVAALRGVAPNQQWGVWAAGQAPGNKDGWSFESDSWGKHWVTDTVGFAGPGERYAVAVMFQAAASGTLAEGVHTVSDTVALLFGAPVPATITVPAPDG